MKTLIIIFIFWAVFKALSDRVKDGSPVPSGQEEELPTYKLPSVLREKWGPKNKEKKIPQPADLELAEPPVNPGKYKLVKPLKPVKEPTPAKQVTQYKDTEEVVAACIKGPQDCQGNFMPQVGELSPNMLKKGIILSEILGPPVARRNRNRHY